MKIVVVGLGYVGLSNAVLLAQHNEVIGVDIAYSKVKAINDRKSPIKDSELENYLSTKILNLSASTNLPKSIDGADYVIICTPTNYDAITGAFDTASVAATIQEIQALQPQAYTIIKSTVPIGFVSATRETFQTDNITFSPEFLREGRALTDNLYPSRIIVGDKSIKARTFAQLMLDATVEKKAKVLLTGAHEAEAIKLFSNSYLAMRVAFFNEADTFALSKNLSSQEIIAGISLDPRITDTYNNPSFGYGGYCLPKDTKQLLSNFSGIPQNLISATIESNTTRKNAIVEHILKHNKDNIGIYKLEMKQGSDNFRDSAIIDIIEILKKSNREIFIYEPSVKESHFNKVEVIRSFDEFTKKSDIIIANRFSSELLNVSQKVFSRDIFGLN